MKKLNHSFRTLFLGAILVASAAVPSSYADLVGYWPLDGDLTDQSGQANNGEIVSDFDAEFENEISAALADQSGQSMFFDGETAVLLGNPDVLNFGTSDFTISAWVLKETGSARGNVYSNGGDNGGGIRSVLAIGETGGDQSVVLTLDDDTDKIQARSGDPNGEFDPLLAEDNEWNHIVGQRRGDEARVYVNGVLADLLATPAGYDLSGQSQLPSYIGVGASAASEPIGEFEKWFVGSIDEVAVWNVALSDADIESLAGGTMVMDIDGGSVGPTCDPNSMGDLDGNGMVEFADFLVLSANFGAAADSHEQGDIDCNGMVEFADFLALSANFGQSVGAAQSVPEPSSALLVLSGALLLLARRQHRG